MSLLYTILVFFQQVFQRMQQAFICHVLQARVEPAHCQYITRAVLQLENFVLDKGAVRLFVEECPVEVLDLDLPYVFVERGWQVDDELDLIDCVEEACHWVFVEGFQLFAVDLHHFQISKLLLFTSVGGLQVRHEATSQPRRSSCSSTCCAEAKLSRVCPFEDAKPILELLYL